MTPSFGYVFNKIPKPQVSSFGLPVVGPLDSISMEDVIPVNHVGKVTGCISNERCPLTSSDPDSQGCERLRSIM